MSMRKYQTSNILPIRLRTDSSYLDVSSMNDLRDAPSLTKHCVL